MTRLTLRKIVSLIGVWSFIFMGWTGVLLYFVPPGRIAYWVGWEFAGFTKTQYGEIHQTFAVLFLLAMILHIWLNWKSIMLYLKNSSKKFVFFTKEMIIATVIAFMFFFGTLNGWSPFQDFLWAVTDYKDGYEEIYGNPPFGHAELVPLNNFCLKMKLDLAESIRLLEAKGIKVQSPKDQLNKIAKMNNLTPADIYDVIKKAKKKPVESNVNSNAGDDEMHITGIGRMKVSRLAELAEVPLDKAMKRLAAKGIQAEVDSKVKTLSTSVELMPMDLYHIVKGDYKE